MRLKQLLLITFLIFPGNLYSYTSAYTVEKNFIRDWMRTQKPNDSVLVVKAGNERKGEHIICFFKDYRFSYTRIVYIRHPAFRKHIMIMEGPMESVRKGTFVLSGKKVMLMMSDPKKDTLRFVCGNNWIRPEADTAHIKLKRKK